jgi:hypothetical protein
MSDESFSDNFMWYEWGFVAPEDLRAEDANAAGTERTEREPAVRTAGWDTVWTRERP